MSVPSPTIATSGTGAAPITADNFNTYMNSGMTLSSARAFSGVQNQEIHLIGYTSTNDGGQGIFVWTLGTGTDDAGVTTIVPTGNIAGYWARVGNASAIYSPQTVSNASNVNLSAANVINQVLIFTGGTTPTNTFPTAASIISAMTGAQVGSIRDLLIISENSGSTTLSTNTGVTFTGNLSTGSFVVSATSQRLFKIYYAGSGAINVYG